MKNAFRLIVLALLVGGWTLAASALYVVRTPGGFVVIPKNRLGFADTYVDARDWTLADVPAHAPVVLRVVAAGKAGQLSELAPRPATRPGETSPAVDQVALRETLLAAAGQKDQ